VVDRGEPDAVVDPHLERLVAIRVHARDRIPTVLG
jgi:hypothetical protein